MAARPASIAWIGRSVFVIYAELKDPTRNGNHFRADIRKHDVTDGPIGWGWVPGNGHKPAPGTQEIFGDLSQAWNDTEFAFLR